MHRNTRFPTSNEVPGHDRLETATRWLRPAAACASMLLLALWARDAVPQDETLPDVPAAQASSWPLLARTYAASGQWEQACEAFGRATDSHPHDATLWAERARAAMAQTKVPSSTSTFAVRAWVRRALQLDAEQPLALTLAGDLAYADGNLPAAQQHWQQASEQARHVSQAEPALPDLLRQRLESVSAALAATNRWMRD